MIVCHRRSQCRNRSITTIDRRFLTRIKLERSDLNVEIVRPGSAVFPLRPNNLVTSYKNHRRILRHHEIVQASNQIVFFDPARSNTRTQRSYQSRRNQMKIPLQVIVSDIEYPIVPSDFYCHIIFYVIEQ